MLQRMFTEIRAKNLFIFIIAPTFMDINKYFAIWRSKCLLHVYSIKGDRGYCSFFNADRKKKLYIIGKKKFYDYQCVFPNFRFRFTNCAKDVVDWDAYKAKKTAKNLEIADEGVNHQSVEKQVREEVVKNNKKRDKPLTQKELAQLLGCHSRSIERYTKAVKLSQPTSDNILPNLNPKITPTIQEKVRTIQDSKLNK